MHRSLAVAYMCGAGISLIVSSVVGLLVFTGEYGHGLANALIHVAARGVLFGVVLARAGALVLQKFGIWVPASRNLWALLPPILVAVGAVADFARVWTYLARPISMLPGPLLGARYVAVSAGLLGVICLVLGYWHLSWMSFLDKHPERGGDG